ncbi:virulence RhuM family protein [Morganella morganii]|nr:virulence RhuM family protein [Morganella morganii]EKK5569088.1 virulence RhuM family protein [Morganella morganii]
MLKKGKRSPERIRDIRAGERRVYLRVKDIFAMAANRELRTFRYQRIMTGLSRIDFPARNQS